MHKIHSEFPINPHGGILVNLEIVEAIVHYKPYFCCCSKQPRVKFCHLWSPNTVSEQCKTAEGMCKHRISYQPVPSYSFTKHVQEEQENRVKVKVGKEFGIS